MSSAIERRVSATATFGACVVLAAIALASALLAVAMALYPGGTAFDHASSGHSFWFNFLCDLTSRVAVNGRSNATGSRFAMAAMMMLAVALGGFWLILPALFRARRRLALVTRTSGVVSVGGLVAVPMADGPLHLAAVFASSVPALVAGVVGIVGIVNFFGEGPRQAVGGSALSAPRHGRQRLLAGLAFAAVAAAFTDSVLYARSYLTHPRVIVPALPLFQRVALLSMLAWMAAVALEVLGTRRQSGLDVTRG